MCTREQIEPILSEIRDLLQKYRGWHTSTESDELKQNIASDIQDLEHQVVVLERMIKEKEYESAVEAGPWC